MALVGGITVGVLVGVAVLACLDLLLNGKRF